MPSLPLPLALPLVLIAVLAPAALRAQQPLTPVPQLDLKRYAGKWFEQGRTPNWFQKKCAKQTSAEYTLRPDGKITVVNSCLKENGEVTVAKGTAKLASPNDPARLKVSFFWPFSGNYWVIGLDPDYRWAVVGEPDRKYLWLLTRDQNISPELYAKLLEVAKAKGYNPANVARSLQ